MTKTTLTAAAVLLTAAGLLPLVALAQGIGTIANPVIDQAQPTVADWISTGITSAVWGFLAFMARKTGIKFIEKMNRDAIRTAAVNFANFAIDELQERFLGAAPGVSPDLSDLIVRGVDYVRGGSKDAIAESGIATDRLAKQVEGALREKGAELLTAALRDAGAPVR